MSGTWNTAGRWTPAGVPNNGNPAGSSYDAVIAATGSPYTVTLDGSVTVDSLTLDSANATIDHTSGTLNLTNDLVLNAGTYQFDGGTIRGGRISGTGGEITFQPQGTFDGVTIDRDLTFSLGNFSDAWIDVRNGLTLSGNHVISLAGADFTNESVELRIQGDQAISGNGTIRATGRRSNRVFSVGGTVTIGQNITAEAVGDSQLHMGDENSGLANNGLITARGGGHVILEAANWINEGQIRVTPNSIVELRGSTTTAGFGSVINVGGDLWLQMTVDNTGSVFDFDRIVGEFDFSHATIVGGTIRGTSPIELVPLTSSGGISFRDVTVDADLQLHGATLGLADGMTIANNHRIELREATTIELRTPQFIGGTGEIVATVLPNSSGSTSKIRGTGFTIGPGITFRSDDEVPSEFLGMSVEGDNWINGGTIIADHGQLSLEGTNWRNLGTIRVVGGTLHLDGEYSHSSLGDLTLGPGEHILDGRFDNTGNTFRVGGSAPTWAVNSGTFVGGRLEIAPGTNMRFSSGRLGGVSVSGEVTVSSVFYEDTVTLDNAVIHVGSQGSSFPDFSPLGDAALQGTGRVLLNGSGPSGAGFGLPVNAPVLPEGIVVESTAGDGRIFGRDGVGWTNDGTVLMRASGRTVMLQGASVTNRGLIRVENGGLIDTETSLVNEGDIEVARNGNLIVRQAYRQMAAGQLTLELGGNRRGVDYAFLDARSSVFLNGTLHVELATGFTPRVGHRFDILQWNLRIGEFAGVELPSLPFGRSWDTSALYSTGELLVMGVPPIGETIAHSDFDEPPLNASSFSPSANQTELGFVTTSTPNGVSPTASVQLVGTNRVFTHRSVNATTTFADIDLASWLEGTVSLDIQVANTTYEAGDFVRVYITDGVQSLDLFNETGNNGTDGLDNLATAGFLTYSADVPFDWSTVSLVIASFSNSSAAAERFDFDNIRFTAVAVPEPSSTTLAFVSFLVAALYAKVPPLRRWFLQRCGVVLGKINRRGNQIVGTPRRSLFRVDCQTVSRRP